MKQISHISIPDPCTQNWDNMLPNGNERFCDNCQKSVTDFSHMSNSEILRILSSSPVKVCGRLTESQLLGLNHELISERMPLFAWQKISLAAALMAVIPFVNVQAKAIFQIEQGPVERKKTADPLDTNLVDRVIKGNIIDINDKQALPGVTVKIKGTNTATATDMAGNFSIHIPVKAEVVLLVYYVGYQTQEIKISADETICDLKLKAVPMMLGEVIVRRPPIWKRPYYALRRVIRKVF